MYFNSPSFATRGRGENGLKQNGGNWTKYGMTFKMDKKYFYLTAIPLNDFVFPDYFTTLEIPKGEYEIF